MTTTENNKILSELGNKLLEKEEELKKLKEEIETLENQNEDLHEEYDDMLNDVGIDNILKDYLASDILKSIDEVKYNLGYDEYIDSRVSDLQYNQNDLVEEINKLKEEK